MVNGCTMVFSAQKMIDGLAQNGKPFEEISKMDGVLDNFKRLDGCEVTSHCWKREVKFEPVYYVEKDKNGNNGEYVPDWACVYPSEWTACTLF